MTLGEKITMLRKSLGMTQVELAERLHTTKQTIGKYEHGIVYNLPLSRVQQLADVLRCEPEYLLGWTEDEEPGDLSKDEIELIMAFRKVSEADRKKAIGMVQLLAEV